MTDFYVGQKVIDDEGAVFIVEGIGDGNYVCAEQGVYGSDENGNFHWCFKDNVTAVAETSNLPIGTRIRFLEDKSESALLGFYKGETATIVESAYGKDDCDYKVVADSRKLGYLNKKLIGTAFEVVEQTESQGVRIAELEARVAKLEAELKKLRIGVAERARKDVAELLKKAGRSGDRDGFTSPLAIQFLTETKFVVNEDKRTVVALVRRVRTSEVKLVGKARCHPNDKFDADIGKAIALRKAFGMTIPAEYIGGDSSE